MKKTRFTETKIVSILKKQEAGIPTADICREFSISQVTFYNWKAKYGGLEVRELKRLSVSLWKDFQAVRLASGLLA